MVARLGPAVKKLLDSLAKETNASLHGEKEVHGPPFLPEDRGYDLTTDRGGGSQSRADRVFGQHSPSMGWLLRWTKKDFGFILSSSSDLHSNSD
jgi:hypothetical protein